MPRLEAFAETIVDAPAGVVYGVLADYRRHHPRIMPPALFSDLQVERGGIGAGTVFHITVRAPGRPRRLHMLVAEPTPGRQLTETDLDTGVVTAFEVSSRTDLRSDVRISVEWEPARGMRGLVERLAVWLVARPVFMLQLEQLRRYLQSDSFFAYSKGLAR
jgi:hypothetical protein